jgi:tetratricopeptide (TPR) repeat protein
MGLWIPSPTSAADEVTIREEKLVLPTYLTREPSIFPIFYNGRAYQGAQGRVYPYAFWDELTDERREVTYRAVYLENRYIRLCVLPELGGRIFSAQDKTTGYDFFYRQSVIKPALIGMLGAWISGGVEWNVPHHHRATSFQPVDCTVQENSDGSKTIWIGELELRHRMSWAIGLTLYPDRSCIQSTVRIINRTPLAHSFLYWANVAVHTNEDYQVIFPPGTRYVTYHGKNQFARWPVAHETYNRVDYSSGVDISWWKNHPSPTSFFAWNYTDDFLAGYDHGRRAGVIHVADHHIMPGKKFWTWGTGSQGKRWETILSDRDGPYLELMVGAWSDNQPDYCWIQPYETRTISHYWYPLREIGGVKAANLDAALNLEVTGRRAYIGVNVSSRMDNAEIMLWAGGERVLEERVSLAPDNPFHSDIALPEGVESDDLRLVIKSSGAVKLSYTPRRLGREAMPEPAVTPSPPSEIKTNEELYLAGLRLEQFYHPSLDPEAYYFEALRRDPGDARANTQMGIRFLKRGMFKEAVMHLERANERLGWNHTRPKDGEALYYLGLARRALGKTEAAVDALERAAWDPAWRPAACFVLAEMACADLSFGRALNLLDRAGGSEGSRAKGLNLRAVLLRHMGEGEKAAAAAAAALRFNPLDFWAANELYLSESVLAQSERAAERRHRLQHLMRDEVQSYLELATDYMRCGLYAEARNVLKRFEARDGAGHAIVLYYLGFLEYRIGEEDRAREYLKQAAACQPDRCFPFREETVGILEQALRIDHSDSRAWYYLGNCLFDIQPEKAVSAWEKARDLGEDYFLVYRNLGMGYARVMNDEGRAVTHLEKAVALDASHARLFYELDRMCEATGADPAKRLALLEKNHRTVEQRDDALTQEIKLLVHFGRYEDAIRLLDDHHFHVWEGGGQIHDYYVHAHLMRGNVFMQRNEYLKALHDFELADAYPENLEVGRPIHGGRRAQIWYFIGTALEALNRKEAAREAYSESIAIDRGWSELSFYQGMSLKRLGQVKASKEKFQGLMKHAAQRLESSPALDFFAKFGERQSAAAHRAQSIYLLGLAQFGLGKKSAARTSFDQAIELNPNHFWARFYRDSL